MDTLPATISAHPTDARADAISRLRSITPRTHLLVVQPTPFCNINCSYCYLTSRSSRATMSDETLDNLFRKFFSSGWSSRQLSLAWHAGEPTVLPVSYYERAIGLLEAHRPRHVEVRHAIQTNATLLTKEWTDFFRRHQIHVGVSVDGPQRLNDQNRLSRSGQSTFAKVQAGLRLLRDQRVPFHVITVLSNAGLASPRELHDFYVAEGIERVGFNVEESEGTHISDVRPGDEGVTAFRDFLSNFWQIAAQAGRVKAIREIDFMVASIFQRPNAAMGNELVEPFSIVNVDHAGNVATFSPELLGQKNEAYDDFIVGNVNTDEFADLPYRPQLARMYADIQEGVAMCREQCAYFGLCGGGEPVNKLAENGTFASSVTNFCRLTRMTVADLVSAGPHG